MSWKKHIQRHQDILQHFGRTDASDSVDDGSNAVRHLLIEKFEYAQIFCSNSQLQQVVQQAFERLGPIADFFAEDVFYVLYKYNYEFRPLEELNAIGRMSCALLESLENAPPFRSLRFFTRGNAFNAALGTIKVVEELFYQLQGQEAPEEFRPDPLAQLQQAVNDVLDAFQQVQNAHAGLQKDLSNLQQQHQQDMDPSSRRKLQNEAKNLDALNQGMNDDLRQLQQQIANMLQGRTSPQAAAHVASAMSQKGKEMSKRGNQVEGQLQKMLNNLPQDAQQSAQDASASQKIMQQALDELQNALKNLMEQLQQMGQGGQADDLGSSMAGAIRNMLNQSQSLQEELQRLQNELNYLERMSQNVQSRDLQHKIEHLREKIKQKKQQLEQTLSSMEKIGQSKEMAKAAHQATDIAQDTVSHLSDSLSNWGIEQGMIHSRPIPNQMELLNRLLNSNVFERLADLVGKFRQIGRSKVWRIDLEGRGRVRGVEHGRDLSSALPAEVLQLMGNEAMKWYFVSRYVDTGILQLRQQSRRYGHRGAIVACIDQSGSMDGKKSDYASALALGLAEIALKKKRPYLALIFSGPYDRMCEIEIDPGNPDPNDLLRIAETVIGGGTCFEKPLKRAMELIRERPQFRDADILLITDGEAPISKEFRAEFVRDKERYKVHLYSLLVDVGDSTDSSLKEISDDIFLVTQITQEVAEQIYEKVARDQEQ